MEKKHQSVFVRCTYPKCSAKLTVFISSDGRRTYSGPGVNMFMMPQYVNKLSRLGIVSFDRYCNPLHFLVNRYGKSMIKDCPMLQFDKETGKRFVERVEAWKLLQNSNSKSDMDIYPKWKEVMDTVMENRDDETFMISTVEALVSDYI